MNQVEKLLKKLNANQRAQNETVLLLLYANRLTELNIKKLKGHSDIFRLRAGDYWIIFRRRGQSIAVLDIRKRDDQTYKDY